MLLLCIGMIPPLWVVYFYNYKDFLDWCHTCQNWCYFTGYFTDASKTFAGYPIWITEFAGSGTTQQQQSFLEYVIPWLETQSFVERYAAFGKPLIFTTTYVNLSVLIIGDFAGNYVNNDGSLTALGTTYASTVQPPPGWNSSCNSNS